MSRACEFFDGKHPSVTPALTPEGKLVGIVHDVARPVRVYIRVSEDGAIWNWVECEITSTGTLKDIAEGFVPAGSEKLDSGEVNVRWGAPKPHGETMLPENGGY